MRKEITAFALCASLFALSFPAGAQQAGKIFWIGYLAGAGSGPSPAFIQGLRDLGYIEGKNIAFAYRTMEGRGERYAELAAELVSLKVDIIIADGTGPGPGGKKGYEHHPDCVGDRRRSCWKRTRGEFGAAGWKCHWVDKPKP